MYSYEYLSMSTLLLVYRDALQGEGDNSAPYKGDRRGQESEPGIPERIVVLSILPDSST